MCKITFIVENTRKLFGRFLHLNFSASFYKPNNYLGEKSLINLFLKHFQFHLYLQLYIHVKYILGLQNPFTAISFFY